jgi:hypothetical protein
MVFQMVFQMKSTNQKNNIYHIVGKPIQITPATKSKKEDVLGRLFLCLKLRKLGRSGQRASRMPLLLKPAGITAPRDHGPYRRTNDEKQSDYIYHLPQATWKASTTLSTSVEPVAGPSGSVHRPHHLNGRWLREMPLSSTGMAAGPARRSGSRSSRAERIRPLPNTGLTTVLVHEG